MANVQLKNGQKLQPDDQTFRNQRRRNRYYKKLIVFCPASSSGRRMIAEVTKATPRFAEARMTKLIKKSSDRILPPVKFYDRCRGLSITASCL